MEEEALERPLTLEERERYLKLLEPSSEPLEPLKPPITSQKVDLRWFILKGSNLTMGPFKPLAIHETYTTRLNLKVYSRVERPSDVHITPFGVNVSKLPRMSCSIVEDEDQSKIRCE